MAGSNEDSPDADKTASSCGTSALIWSILKSQSEDEIAQKVACWYENARRKPALQEQEIQSRIHARDWEGAKSRLEQHFGRYHPHYKPAMDVLMSASQCQRMLLVRARQRTMDELMTTSMRGQSF